MGLGDRGWSLDGVKGRGSGERREGASGVPAEALVPLCLCDKSNRWPLT